MLKKSLGFLSFSRSRRATGARMTIMSRRRAAGLQHVRRRILDEDEHTCRFCGFKAQSWQEVHHINDDHADNRPGNLATTCMFCHLCQHVGRAGAVGEAVLVWCPEIPQDRLHHIVRTYLVAQRWAEGYLNGAKHAAPTLPAGRRAS